MTRALVVDDEPQILRALKINLSARGYDVQLAPDGRTALRLAAEHRPEVVVLDLGLPDIHGVDVITGLRGWTQVPILVLSGRTDSADKVDALDAGADDYVTKPFAMDELLARLRAMVRRAVPEDVEVVVAMGEVTVDLGRRLAGRTGPDGTRHDLHLTPTEWAVLDVLVRNPGRLVSQRQLLAEVWGPAYRDETNYLRIYLGRLRAKLEADHSRPRHLITEPGMGYRFQP
ncbi:MAG TPA: response regulator [Actinomycetales bacterium]